MTMQCTQNTVERGQHSGKRLRITAITACLLSIVSCLLFSTAAPAQDDMLKLIETQRIELQEKQAALKRDEQRLNVLRKEVEEKLAAYTKLLTQVEAAVKKFEVVRDEKLASVVKAYETMPAEDAAVRLSALDDNTALQIMTRMKSKKAGAIIAVMDPRKAAALTRNMTVLSKKEEE